MADPIPTAPATATHGGPLAAVALIVTAVVVSLAFLLGVRRRDLEPEKAADVEPPRSCAHGPDGGGETIPSRTSPAADAPAPASDAPQDVPPAPVVSNPTPEVKP